MYNISMIDIYVCGEAMPNPGVKAIGVTSEIFTHSSKVGNGSSKEAEYEAVIKGLSLAIEYKLKHIRLNTDSSLVLNHIKSNGDIAPVYQEYRKTVKDMLYKFEEVEFAYVRSDYNPARELVDKEFENGAVVYKFER